MNNAKEYFGEDFVQQVNKMFEQAERENKFVFMHGDMTIDDAQIKVSNGFTCDYPELYYTAFLMEASDPLLFEKLKSWPYYSLKYLVTMFIPKNAGKGGIPIWDEDESGLFHLSPQFIYGIIDVNKKSIAVNPKYLNTKENISRTVEDRSFETGTGKRLEVSLSHDEEAMFEEASKFYV